MSYGDDADLLHDRETRVEASKRWHEQNQLRHDFSYRSVSKPKYTYKSTYKPDYSKTYHKPSYSNKSKQQHRRNSSNRRYKNQQKSTYRVISVEESSKRSKQQHSNYNDSNIHDNSSIIGIIVGIICFLSLIYLIGLTFYFYGTISDAFSLIFAIFITILVSALVIECVDKFLNKSNKKSKKRRKTNFKIKGNYNKCQKCGARLSKYHYICPHCGSNDIKKH